MEDPEATVLKGTAHRGPIYEALTPIGRVLATLEEASPDFIASQITFSFLDSVAFQLIKP
jgi:hypothetical protein